MSKIFVITKYEEDFDKLERTIIKAFRKKSKAKKYIKTLQERGSIYYKVTKISLKEK